MTSKIKMTLIATYPKMSEIFMELVKDREDVEGNSIYASFERAAKTAKEIENDVDIILSRGGTAAYIKNSVSIPVTFIPITPFDVVKIVHGLDKSIKEVAFFHYMKNVYGIQDIAKMYQIRIREYSFVNHEDIERGVKDAYNRNIRTIIGGEVAVRIAKRLGMQGYQVSAGMEAVGRAIDESIRMLHETQKEQAKAMQLKSAFDTLKEGIVVTDEQQKIVVLNPVAKKLFTQKYEVGDKAGAEIINQHCRKVYQTRREENIYIHKAKNDTYAVMHAPVFQEKNFVGVVSRYEDITKAQELEQKIRKEIHAKGFWAKHHFADILTRDPVMEQIKNRAAAYAAADSAVLIQGESGTGKELFAQSIHNASKRAKGPFVAINCAAIPENLLESELFGYETGAFTGAKKEGKAGLFELAHGGTLFLDEIGEIPRSLQTRLLRVLQEKEIMRVGGNKILPVDVRIISATNQDLKKNAREGKFREDLYYRLNVLQILIPPLRARKRDIELLAESFCRDYGGDTQRLKEIYPLLNRYTWPGNIRELHNVMERYAVLERVIGAEGLKNENLGEILGTDERKPTGDILEIQIEMGGTLNEIIDKVECQVANRYLEEFNYNQELAAKALGIGRTTLWRKSKGKEGQNN